jgi:hypothetical protein
MELVVGGSFFVVERNSFNFLAPSFQATNHELRTTNFHRSHSPPAGLFPAADPADDPAIGIQDGCLPEPMENQAFGGDTIGNTASTQEESPPRKKGTKATEEKGRQAHIKDPFGHKEVKGQV